MGIKNCKCSYGLVFAMTNAINNEVVVFYRDHYGRLTRMYEFPTGGSGTGASVVDPLESQGSLILSQDGRYLFAVNAGSNSISSFRVYENGTLALADVEPSGGVFPNSLSVFNNILYVTNKGDTGSVSNLTGFWVNRDGTLRPILNSTRQLSTSNAQPSCVVFRLDGKLLVVSELSTNLLSAYQVNRDGRLTGPITNPSSGAGPFGSVFLHRGILLVSEAGANALSSYNSYLDGTLDIISSSVPNSQTAVCWVAVSRQIPVAYTSNTGSGTISTYGIKEYGRLVLSDIVYSTLNEIAAPIDSGVSKDGRNFYVLNGNQGSISVFYIGIEGKLILIQVAEDVGLPTLGAQGLAVL